MAKPLPPKSKASDHAQLNRRLRNWHQSNQNGPTFNPKRSKTQRWQRTLRYFYRRFVRLQGSPEAIARGLGCGVFAGLFPLFGLQTILGIALAVLLRANKIMAAAGTWVSNPLTYVPIYAFNFKVGQLLLSSDQQSTASEGLQTWNEVMSLGADILTTLFLGCFVVGLISAISSYFLGLWLVRRARRRRYARRHQVK